MTGWMRVCLYPDIDVHPLPTFGTDDAVLSLFIGQFDNNMAVGTFAVPCRFDVLDAVLQQDYLRLDGTVKFQENFIFTPALGVILRHGAKNCPAQHCKRDQIDNQR